MRVIDSLSLALRKRKKSETDWRINGDSALVSIYVCVFLLKKKGRGIAIARLSHRKQTMAMSC